MYTLYKDRWILDENGVAIAQRCRGTTNEQWWKLLYKMSLNLKLDAESREKMVAFISKT